MTACSILLSLVPNLAQGQHVLIACKQLLP